MSKEINDALIQISNLEESIKKNAQGILASTMKEEIKSLVKESLKEQEVEVDDEEEVITPATGEEGSDEETTYFDDDEDDDELENQDMTDMPDDDADDVDATDDTKVMDIRNLDNKAALDVFKKMGPNDQIEVVKDEDEISLKDGETEYIIKLNESSDMNEEMYEMDFPGSTEVYEDSDVYEKELDKDVMYELELDDQTELDEMDNFELDEDFSERILDLEFPESEFEMPRRGMKDIEMDLPRKTRSKIDRMMEYDDVTEDTYFDEDYDMMEDDFLTEYGDTMEMENFDDLPRMKMRESKDKIYKTKGTGSASKFKYNKKPNQEKGFDTKMKEGPKSKFTGKVKFEYKDSMDGEYKPIKKKVEAKEATRSNNYVKSGKVGNRKGSNMNVNRTEVRKRPNNVNEEVSLLRQKNEEYKNALDVFRTKLTEVAVFNSNLAYATRLFTEHSTTKQEKINILRRFDNVENLKESKNLYKQIKEELGNSVVNESTNLNESVERRVSNTINTGSAVNLIESTTYENPQFMRMKDLMKKIK
jgi:hypothetical protein